MKIFLIFLALIGLLVVALIYPTLHKSLDTYSSISNGTPVVQTGSADIQVNSSLDDCTVSYNGSTWSIDTTGTTGTIGYVSSTDYKSGTGLRFNNTGIPFGESIPYGIKITSAYISVKANASQNATIVTGRITGDEAINPTTKVAIDPGGFTTLVNYQNRRGPVVGGTTSRLTYNNLDYYNITDWNNTVTPPVPVAWVSGNWYNTPDISPIVQEIIGQKDWTSSNSLAFFYDDHENRSTNTNGTTKTFYTYDSSPANAPKLHLEWYYYTAYPNGQSFDAATSFLITAMPYIAGGILFICAVWILRSG